MMTDLELTGVVGWDFSAADFRRDLSAVSGDVRLRIHSPGGEVTDGIDIANAIRAHRRSGNTVTAYVSGICMSMATYIASVCDTVEVEDNAVYMVHNPWSFEIGDYRAMAKAGEILSGLSRVLATTYAERTQRRIDVIRSEMDAETWLFGAEIIDAGYADAVVDAGEGAETKDDAMAMARARWSGLKTKMKERDPVAFDRIAAMLPLNNEVPAMAETPDDKIPDPIEPEVPAVDPVAIERSRVTAIIDRCAAVKMPELAQAAILDGSGIDALNARIVDTYASRGGPELRSAKPEGKTAPDVSAAQKRIFDQVANGGRV